MNIFSKTNSFSSGMMKSCWAVCDVVLQQGSSDKTLHRQNQSQKISYKKVPAACWFRTTRTKALTWLSAHRSPARGIRRWGDVVALNFDMIIIFQKHVPHPAPRTHGWDTSLKPQNKPPAIHFL
jgi:hypothetical protein